MPEIIEAEITKQKLAPIMDRRILEFWTDWPRGLFSQKRTVNRTISSIKGKHINGLSRRGKVIIVELEKDRVLAFHQRMSGRIVLKDKNISHSKYEHFRFLLDNDLVFALHDPRKFGTVWYGSKKWFEEQPYIKKLGCDAFQVTPRELRLLLKTSSASIKSFFLSQEHISGLGNIACDEMFFRAGLNPARKANTLRQNEVKRLHNSLMRTLKSLLHYGGTSMSDWRHPDGEAGEYQKHFRIYKRDTCPRCNNRLTRKVVAGRGTYMCFTCQS